MARIVSPALQRLIRDRKITPAKISPGMISKELEGAESDLVEARNSVNSGRHKWATVQAYYSSFHSARALLYAKDYREQGHRGLLSAIRELYSREIPESLLEAFEDSINMREAADYGLSYSEEGARTSLETAEEFLEKTRLILQGKKFQSSHPGFRFTEGEHEASHNLLGEEKRKKARKKKS